MNFQCRNGGKSFLRLKSAMVLYHKINVTRNTIKCGKFIIVSHKLYMMQLWY